jgi:methylated-DNA-[protein]-cysteine S-methyltransferase
MSRERGTIGGDRRCLVVSSPSPTRRDTGTDSLSLRAVIAETALGFAGVALSPLGIRCATLFHHTREACARELQAYGATDAPDPRAGEIIRALQDYARGEGPALEAFPVDLPACTPFQRKTWLALRTIPFGETRSYSWLANAIGEPGKARIVGATNGANPIPLWLPCHRVIGADGRLVGYAGGLAMKRTLLELEGAIPRSLV